MMKSNAMSIRWILYTLTLVTVFLVKPAWLHATQEGVDQLEMGFAPLFDGSSLDGWEGNSDLFRIEDGAIVAGSLQDEIPRNEFLATTREYDNFELRLSVKLTGSLEKANAGIQIRSRRILDHHEMIGYQADMGVKWWGCLYDESRRRKRLAEPDWDQLIKVLKLDDWNEYVIRCQGKRVQLWINGFQTVDYIEEDDTIEQNGLIALQIHKGPASEAWYKNIRIRPLSPVSFRKHAINTESFFETAGIVDINNDGHLDIFCGGFWYEAPKWEKHFVREIETQKEYHLDFANLPYDVDGDGWMDIISVAWHNQTLFWVRNPGNSGNSFEVIEIDKPGNMETALLADISGDGHPDILPAINRAPAWYESKLNGSMTEWIKHELPEELVDHGIGSGDVDSDGRTDIVGPRGWLQHTGSGPWEWHAEFELGKTSVPILVHDVDGDNDSDILWGLGHDYGLYWLEQGQDEQGRRSWKKHLIDDSWSQPHFLALADLDKNGRQDLITGKRYRAHNGKDPGGDEPRCVYWYSFNPKTKSWKREVANTDGDVGLGLMTKLEDIDGDGDIDILAPGKSGLYLLENLLK